MKRFFILAALLLTSSSAHAAGLMVTNNSGLPIDELYASPPGKTEWGTNLMAGIGEGMLDTGKAHDVAVLADGVYDLRISAPDEGILCVMKDITIKDSKVELTADMGKGCK